MTDLTRTVALLQMIRDTVQRYGDHHLAKDPPQIEKAAANYNMVFDINHELARLAESRRLSAGLPPSPARERLACFLDTLGDRSDDAFVTYNALVGDLRALTKDS